MKSSTKNFLIHTNPALWFVLTCIILLLVIIALNFDRFDFKDADLFTFFYTYIAVILLHTGLNRKRFKLFTQRGIPETIYKSYLQLTWLCLPYLLIAVVYENLILFSKAFEDTFSNVDLFLMRVDEAMFGVQPTIWLQKFIYPLAVEYFMVAYGMFFVYPFIYLIYLLQRNRLDVFYRVIMAQVISLVVSLSCYILFPAIGPRF
ncbi:MAG: phosphatase PAP2 family protein, partial [Desulfobacterales bacterium]|nr:phosphatase PAP2 family protein [Desulfobacterales bacterium]